MPLVLLNTPKVRKALAAPGSFGIELLVLACVGAAIGGIVLMAKQVSAPMRAQVDISLSPWALPGYTALTLLRGIVAYFLSLGFTLIYGTIAAHNKRAEKVMIPVLDVLQSLPVLSFLPGLVIALVDLFPTRELGLELACIITIFTGQVWNMTFSFFGSVRGIPPTLREAAAVQHLGGWQIFKVLELPASMIGLVWNSMMSMAGGWFFIATVEAFTLKDRDYRLPGLGSYMSEAIKNGNVRAEISAVIAMIIMIVVVDQVIWRPIVVWAERYKLEDVAATDAPQSWVMNLFGKSKILSRLGGLLNHRPKKIQSRTVVKPVATGPGAMAVIGPIVKWTTLTAIAVGSVWGFYHLILLLIQVPLRSETHKDWLHIVLALGASLLRVFGSLVIGAAWTLPVGILIGLSPRWSQRLQPVVQVVASYPAPMIFPLLVAVLAIIHVPFTVGCTALILIGTQWYVLFNVIAGAMAIPSDLREAASVYRLSTWTVWKNLYIPAVFPYLVTGLVTAAGGAWNATIVAEYLAVKDQTYSAFGLGSMITEASSNDFPMLAACVITMAVFVVTINRLVWKRLYRTAERRYSLAI
jgi:NitT/TauT family transport system permease protein